MNDVLKIREHLDDTLGFTSARARTSAPRQTRTLSEEPLDFGTLRITECAPNW